MYLIDISGMVQAALFIVTPSGVFFMPLQAHYKRLGTLHQ